MQGWPWDLPRKGQYFLSFLSFLIENQKKFAGDPAEEKKEKNQLSIINDLINVWKNLQGIFLSRFLS